MPDYRPRILVTTSPAEYLGEPSVRLSENYADAVIAAGGLPVVLPLSEHGNVYSSYLDMADGLLLSGGCDIEPSRYGDPDPRRLSEKGSPLRDSVELDLLAGAEERRLPVLGICRGMQIINVAHGGTLYADIPAQFKRAPGHLAIRHNEHMDGRVAHEVNVAAGSQLSEVLGMGAKGGRLAVNSLHHQAVRALAPGLALSASSTDGVAEALENPSYPFMMGVQWHPEYMAGREPMSRIFSAFCSAARSFSEQR